MHKSASISVLSTSGSFKQHMLQYFLCKSLALRILTDIVFEFWHVHVTRFAISVLSQRCHMKSIIVENSNNLSKQNLYLEISGQYELHTQDKFLELIQYTY